MKPTRKNKPPRTPADQVARLTRILDIPTGTLGGNCQLELSGNREAIVDGCKGILAYDDNTIKLAAGKLHIAFTGRGLQVRTLTHTSAIVEGYITGIAFEEVAR